MEGIHPLVNYSLQVLQDLEEQLLQAEPPVASEPVAVLNPNVDNSF